MNRKQVTLPLIFEIGGSLATDKENYNTQRAMLIHTLLFNQSIVLPDSVAIRNRNFRKLISQDVQISHMLTKDNFSIANRAEGNNTLALLNRRLYEINQIKDDEDFSWNNYDSLSMLETNSSRIDWEYSDVANNFLKMILDYFEHWESDNKKYKGYDIISCIKEFDEGRKDNSKIFDREINDKTTTSIGLNVITEGELFEYLEKSVIYLSDHDKAKIVEFAEAAYFANMPNFLQADPTCSKEQQKKINLVTRLDDVKEERLFDTLKIPTKLNAVQFIHGLNSLTPEDVHFLRDSEAFKTLVSKRKNLKPSDAYIKELVNIFEVYTMLISDKILQNNTYLNRRTNRNTTDIDTFVGEGLSISLTFGLGAQVLPFSGFLASLVYRHIMNKTPAVKRTKAREREESFDSYKKELERTGNTEAIEVEETIRDSGTFERMAVLGNK